MNPQQIKKQKAILLTALLTIKEKGPDPRFGICTNMEWHTMNVQGVNDYGLLWIMREYYKEWPEYTGDELFPVPHPELECFDAYVHAEEGKWNGQYGDSRRRLLDFLIAELQKDSE